MLLRGLGIAVVGAAVMLHAAAIVGAEQPRVASSVGQVVPPTSATAAATREAFPPVTEHHVDENLMAGLAPGGSSAVQVIQVTVVGGPLRLETESATVELVREGDALVGTMPSVRVVDARGTHPGWRVRYRIDGLVEPSDVGSHLAGGITLVPHEPVVVAGSADGLAPGPERAAARGWGELFHAAPGSGGGTYEAGASLSAPVPAGSPIQSALLSFTFAVR